MNILLKSMAIVLSLIAGLQAAEDIELTPTELTPTEKENAYKMWLMKEALEKGANEGTLPKVPEDVQDVIGGKLHELANPVLDGKLEYTDEGKKTIFKIMDLLKDGCIDLSNKDIFGDASDHLLITTDPEMFFRIDTKSVKLHVLIAPRFLIEEKIESTASHFQPIMNEWSAALAPIGIFYRMGYWSSLGCFDNITQLELTTISKNSLHKILCVRHEELSRPPDLTSTCAAVAARPIPWCILRWCHMVALNKISCLF